MSSEQVDLSRRGFLRGNLLTRQGRENDRMTREALGPGLPWFASMSAETCGDCVRPCLPACGQDVLRIHPDGHLLASTPWLDFSSAGCTLCGDCAEACPSIDHPVDARRSTLGVAMLDTTACHAWNGVFCMSCIGRCDRKALQLDTSRSLLLDSEHCNGCGACISPCPAGALTVLPTHSVSESADHA